MKTIDIENQKKIHDKATKVLNCISKAHTRIADNRNKIAQWRDEFFYTRAWCEKNIAAHKAAIVKLEKFYHKTISQL